MPRLLRKFESHNSISGQSQTVALTIYCCCTYHENCKKARRETCDKVAVEQPAVVLHCELGRKERSLESSHEYMSLVPEVNSRSVTTMTTTECAFSYFSRFAWGWSDDIFSIWTRQLKFIHVRGRVSNAHQTVLDLAFQSLSNASRSAPVADHAWI